MFWLVVAYAQQLRFPTTAEHHAHWYPTAYVDHDGVDWACGDIRYDGHGGSDFGAGGWVGMNEGRDVVAAAVGVVKTVSDGHHDKCVTGDCPGGGGFGNHVRILHPDGTETVYAHMKKDSVAVQRGQGVQCGQLLGQMGSSGFSTGPHLHFELRTPQNERVDPFSGECHTGWDAWMDPGEHGALPSLECEAWPACQPVATVACGEQFSGRTDMAGASDIQDFHGCNRWREYTGPEVALVLDVSQRVTVTVSGLDGDIDAWILEDLACDATACLDDSANSDLQDESLTVDTDGPVVLVLDGWRDAVSPFTVEVSCQPIPDERDPNAKPDKSRDTAVQAPDPAPADPKGCSHAPIAALWWVPLVVLGRRRRV